MAGAIRVVAAVIARGKSYLVCRRPEHKRYGGLWEFPGGKVLDDESIVEAVGRELAEELDVTVLDVGQPLFVAQDPGSPFLIEFRPVAVRGEPRALEHTAVRWASVPELSQLRLAPADARFVREHLSGRPRE